MAASRVSCAVRFVNRVKCAAGTWQPARSVTSEARRSPGRWQLVSAICLQRLPLITAELTPLQRRYQDLQADRELESSILSDHELRAKEDRALAEKKQQAEEMEQGEGEVEGARLTALDLEDAWDAEAKEFAPATRLTDDDRRNDSQSVERKLDQPLFLLVKQTLGARTHWVFPQGPRQEGESMRQAAERVLQTHCGEGTKAQFLGNAPCGFYQYAFPQSADMGTGAKVFFFKAWYSGGEVRPGADAADYMWVSRDQLPQFCSKAYLKSIREFLVDV